MTTEQAGKPEKEMESLMDSLYGLDRDTEIRCRSFKVVKTRKPQKCMCCAHEDDALHGVLPAGTRMCRERALVDGSWGSCYVCVACLESWAKWRTIAGGDPTDWKCEGASNAN